MATLFIIATPIGNLEDITLRALRVLKEVDLVLAEDTRVTQKLLRRYEIKKPVERYDEHIAEHIHARIAEDLRQGKSIALVSDAGTPGISDPGARLVAYVREHVPDVSLVPIPGPSALITALSVAGVSADSFTFLGYPPHKKGRKTFFQNVRDIKVRPVVVYESPHRLQKTFTGVAETIGEDTNLIVVKELTKIYEEIWHGSVKEATSYFQKEKGKGEFVVIIV
ncbi:MAG: 16S rRNA (cytidine(1402)-2'-O)-methyltransferase [Candidatus Ryanbacteria bacterium RIFCSPHIGHO2_02_FULL_45_17b]|uniref:Ribosomal RNA small subunit methyltransferase I n=1 Tax=Candidatus Ryanbacteria bacterium RIFCSPHIGHO2_01_FULL_45_22 TaxID=1802114 RepID=A0A1G2G011_9BACT|nr:MAG: 16S rRNA (cytidine(1402)-2'-O)-methyltransferase [Candidatus Ryanbacteria bacterium RIFCSPHIGHO2_01_FULL_45_22]OGZ46736.1 MAG: 16S rRNA (cytidine(1402)-2'-O)-methyltransferase [Candidatus Ryanbacteria bacterium RIFCSPHIGHO2_02_FULL_45_17b]